MLQLLRTFLGWPFSKVFAFFMRMRRNFYNREGGIHRQTYPFPVVGVGNLSTGGTGKTPHVEYIARLLQPEYTLAILSRGYGRKTKGFLFADHTSDCSAIGDEPMQFHKKFPYLPIAVDENRKNGIERIRQTLPDTRIFLLDDAYQHLIVKPGLNILLTDYNRLYMEDHVLPYGNLREPISAAKEADIIIVTKCPNVLSQFHERTIIQKINAYPHQKIFFSYMKFKPLEAFNEAARQQKCEVKSVVLMTAIANSQPLIRYLKDHYKEFQSVTFRDHHQFTTEDIKKMLQYLNRSISPNKAVIVTEKDAMRLYNDELYSLLKDYPVYTIPIEVDFHPKYKESFNQYILNYVKYHS